MQAYDAAGDDRNFEIVLVGYDKDHAAMADYMKTSKMNFLGIKKSEAPNTKLSQLGSTGSLPAVVLATPDGDVVTTDFDAVLAKLTQ